ncbi:LysR substrate-binding domain-containing protein [Amphritea sp.]|uniref:LysR substrate-binding domain-containing protein n=1 Tax=Amphritea sp. TaxID=1872502 RepID=UPI003D0D8137
MNQLPPLNDIQVFVVAARLQGFSSAADSLDVSPAYISKRINLLEKHLGVRLFIRNARQVILSPEGKIALEWSERLLETMEQMEAEIVNEQLIPKGKLRIVTSSGFGSHFIAPVVSRFSQQYPQLEIDLELLDRPVDLISEGFDIELRVGGELPQQLIARRLCENQRILCAAPAYLEEYGTPQQLAELNRHRCIGIRERDQSYGHWRLESRAGKKSIKLTAPLTTNNGSVAKQWCLDGRGIMLRSVWNIREELNRGHLIRILPDYSQQADIHAIYPSRLETSAKRKVFVTLLETALKKV